ncbi:flagellar basal body L-ring protein [Legionella qingyii]|uniref:Flagellar L-ring protein n=1 Tax=Legionella qingyii TaxID=2184757 RepID=A0A317U2P5_9GAMM|nr:flagellar basal body L-ring protein FlgH [Legionella qingyii]PWY55619.1 flagellar basal body L-ring protein [Legionella qingyii]RUR21786.1 flagellar basal body L-ring protein [Legionella qingyii]RUR25286.1 flagellar basal body L-ring protein [Legionella qingyii]
MKLFNLLVVSSVAILLSGCELLNPPQRGKDPEYAPTYPTTPDPKELRKESGAIYSAETALPLFETPRARHPGDIITVFLVESTNASKNATLQQMKTDTNVIKNKLFLGKPISFGNGYSMDFDLNNQRQFNGSAQAVQNNKLAGSISVTVSEVLANGNMVVQGEKWVKIDQGEEYVRVSGIIRPQDVRADNSITSDRLANARIAYGGTGQVNNTNAQGWLARIMWGPLFPT